jgi:hypothetical protein
MWIINVSSYILQWSEKLMLFFNYILLIYIFKLIFIYTENVWCIEVHNKLVSVLYMIKVMTKNVFYKVNKLKKKKADLIVSGKNI